MASQLIMIRIVDSQRKKLRDLEVSATVAVGKMLPVILRKLHVEDRADWELWLDRTRIDPGQSLLAAGVRDGCEVVLRRPVDNWRDGRVDLGHNRPALVCPDGLVVTLKDSALLIGRSAPDARPDIDMAPFDSGRLVSRRHAQIEWRGGQCLLTPNKTRNGTYVNGRLTEPGIPQALRSGDVIRFGMNGPELVLRLPA